MLTHSLEPAVPIIGRTDRGPQLRLAEEGVDDLDKPPSFDLGEALRRSAL